MVLYSPMDELYKCCGCKEFLDRESFGGIKKRSDYCRECSRQMSRKYQGMHREKRNAQNRKAAAKRYLINRRNLIDYLHEHPCVDCGESDIIVLDFDHLNPTIKRAKIADVLGSWNWNTILTEIAKCVVRCANCHRRRTAIQFGWFKVVMLNDRETINASVD